MQITTYQEAQIYLEKLIKPFQMEKIAGVPEEYNNPFGRMTYLLNLLDNPQKHFPSVVVSGTSGKGSTTYTIAHMLTSAGYKTGFTISPHLEKINERLQIGYLKQLKCISDADLITLLNIIIPAIDKMATLPLGTPSYFEALLAMTFLYFAKEKVDIAVVEVGFEGKYDGTQTLHPLLFVYTNTSLDHTAILGETVEDIAREGVSVIEKPRSLKEQLIVVSGVKQSSVRRIVQKVCNSFHARLFLTGRDFSYMVRNITVQGEQFDFTSANASFDKVKLSLVGEYQIENASLAIEAVLHLKTFGFEVKESVIRKSLKTAFFPGRFEMKGNIILDGAHNPAKMSAFLASLDHLYPQRKKIFIIGFKKDKDIHKMLQSIYMSADEIILTSYFVTTDLHKSNSLSVRDLSQEVQRLFSEKPVHSAKNVQEAIIMAKKQAKGNELIVITGSLYLVGEARKTLLW